MKENKIGIVLVNYNGGKYQNDCIKTIYTQDYKNIDVVVVDSASTDGSIEKLEEEYPNVHVIREKENVGVAVGNNIGIKYCIGNGAEYVLLLNNDTELDSSLLQNLEKKASSSTVVVPKIYFYSPDNLIWFGGGDMDWKKASGYHIGLREIDNGQYDKEMDISYSPTCCMLLHKSVFEKIGYIDECTFMYYDDTDLCVRLTEKGISIKYVPDAFMWHKVSSSSGGMQSKIGVYYNNRNQLYFIKKYSSKVKFVDKFLIVTKGIVKGLIAPLRKRPNEKYILTAYKDFLFNKMGRKDF